MKFKRAIFDLDGTLCDTVGDLTVAYNFLLSHLGLKELSVDYMKDNIKLTDKQIMKKILPDELYKEEQFDAFLEKYNDYYSEHCTVKTVAYDGIYEMLCKLKQNGIACGVLTNKNCVQALKIVKKYFGDLFDTVMGAMVTPYYKPDPKLTEIVLKEMGATLFDRKTAYIGDSAVDIATAKNAGLYCIAVTYGYGSREELIDADIIVDSVDELKNVLLEK